MKMTLGFVLILLFVGMVAGGVLDYYVFPQTVTFTPGALRPVEIPNDRQPTIPRIVEVNKWVTRYLDSLDIRDSVRITDSVHYVDSALKATPKFAENNEPKPKTWEEIIASIEHPVLNSQDSLVASFASGAGGQSTWAWGFTFAHDFLGGGYTGGLLTRVVFGDFTVFAEVGFWRTFFQTLLGLTFTPWTLAH